MAAFDLGTTLDDPPDDEGEGERRSRRRRRPCRAKRRYRRLGTRPNSSTTASVRPPVRSLGESAVVHMSTVSDRLGDFNNKLYSRLDNYTMHTFPQTLHKRCFMSTARSHTRWSRRRRRHCSLRSSDTYMFLLCSAITDRNEIFRKKSLLYWRFAGNEAFWREIRMRGIFTPFLSLFHLRPSPPSGRGRAADGR